MRTRRGARFGRGALLAAAMGSISAPLSARDPGPVLHEPIPPDVAEDNAMHALVEGDLAATTDASRARADASHSLDSSSFAELENGRMPTGPFRPDRDTTRPRIGRYDDPFVPSIGPFKRLFAFDAVGKDYTLGVRAPEFVPLPVDLPAGPAEQTFFCDLAVELTGAGSYRIPSVGPGARVVRARLTLGARDVAFRLLRDGADNWFIEPTDSAATGRGRVVMTVAIDESALGGPLRDNPWGSMPVTPPLPHNVEREAAEVLATLGVSRRMRPREAIAQLVEYFREFTDSTDAMPAHRSVYLDLALSKKGVCRHRAFAFLVTAQSLGIPTRMVANEAHAWVEVYDGTSWRRIDLGGAGELENVAARTLDHPAYESPADPFGWPDGSRRGSDMIAQARARPTVSEALSRAGTLGPAESTLDPVGPMPLPSPSHTAASGPVTAMDPIGAASASTPEPPAPTTDVRPPSTIDLRIVGAGVEIHRGSPLRVHGSVRAEGSGCPYAAVDIWLRDAETGRQAPIGTAATDASGAFVGSFSVPQFLPAGDYDVVAHTEGIGPCGRGSN